MDLDKVIELLNQGKLVKVSERNAPNHHFINELVFEFENKEVYTVMADYEGGVVAFKQN